MDPAILKLAREVVKHQGKPLRGHPCGHFINSRGEVKPIPGAITSYEKGKPVIARPLKEVQEPRHRRLVPVTIECLAAVDGAVDEAEALDEPAYDPAVERVRSLMFDPEDTGIDEEKNFESTDSEEETSEGESGVQETTVVE